MTDILWLLEHDVFGPKHPLVDAVARAGQRSVRWDDDNWNGPADFLGNPDVPVVFHGSLGNADKIARLDRWEPGAFCNTEGFRCSAWYRELDLWFLNPTHCFTTVRKLVETPEIMQSVLGGSHVFVRPDSPLKPFSGRVVALEGLTAAHLDHGFYYDDLDLPIVVAPARPDLGSEWRFVVAGREVVASSGYVAEGREATADDVPAAVREMAAEITREFDAPDPIYVLDIVETNTTPRLVEVNPFSGADLYRCNPDAVVAAVTAVLP